MANYKSQYTGEQIDEAIGKVLNAPNIYNYDGTVIIEKANSVLGLRRFKDSVTEIDTIDTSGDEFETLIEPYSFSIEPFVSDDLTVSKMTCAFNIYDGTETAGPYVGLYFDNAGWEAVPFTTANEFIGTFNITSTANSTVDEWLLANTEGVSV